MECTGAAGSATEPPPTGRRTRDHQLRLSGEHHACYQWGLMKLLLGFAFLLSPLFAQLVPTGSPIPRRSKPPVVFLNGYQQDCAGSSFSGTFGTADQVLASAGVSSVFFDNCSITGRPPIETLGQEFGKFLAGLRFDDGTPLTTVDVVAHSMGGLIVRSYLSGKDMAGAIFNPPATIPIRKAIFLATPHFGTGIGVLLGPSSDRQVAELTSGSQFLFDLGTWNQGTDDLRGIDAISVVGNGGNGLVVFNVGTGNPRFDDGVVTVTSGSLRFYGPNRTRVISACHVGPGIISVLCPSSPAIADFAVSAASAQIVSSFLAGTSDWQTIGAPAEQNEYLSVDSGLDVSIRSADDRVLAIDTITAASRGTTKTLNTPGTRQVAYTDLIPSGAVAVAATASGIHVEKSVGVDAGGYAAVTLKPGPYIYRLLPAAAVVFPLTVAPGEIIALYGDRLDQSQILVGGKALNLIASSPSQVNAFFPSDVSGLVQVTAKDITGSHTINVLVEPAVPALFTQNQSGQGAASALNAVTNQLVSAGNPLRGGDYVALYLTGLGATTTSGDLEVARIQPTVTVGGKACNVIFAGRAPGFPGLDQINCQIPAGLAAGDANVIVTSGNRTSNTATLAVN